MSTQPSAARYALGSVPNMVRSLLVVLGIVVVVIFMVPRTGSVPRPPIDVTANAAAVAGSTGWAVETPVGLTSGWRATAARYDTTNFPAPTWYVGYETPDGTFVALSQARTSDPQWLAKVTGRGAPTGTRTIDGRTWVEYAASEGSARSLVAGWTGSASGSGAADGVVTVVSGTAMSDLVTLAGHLRPVAAPTPAAS